MKYFTNSSYERMMMQVPRQRREEQLPTVLTTGNICSNCVSYKNGCLGPCYRELIITSKRKEPEKCDL